MYCKYRWRVKQQTAFGTKPKITELTLLDSDKFEPYQLRSVISVLDQNFTRVELWSKITGAWEFRLHTFDMLWDGYDHTADFTLMTESEPYQTEEPVGLSYTTSKILV